MKIAILAAGSSKYFPLFIDKPKCLYHFNGEVQLERVIKVALKFVEEKDLIVVGGYKYQYISKYLKKYHPEVEFKVNYKYADPAIYSFRKAIEDIDDDVVFMFGDENIAEHNVKKICESEKEMAIMCHDSYYYYSLGIMKLRKDKLGLLKDDCYLSMQYMKEVYCFANNKTEYDGNFTIYSGICIGYMMIDLIRRIGNIKVIENPISTYKGNEIDFIHFDSKEYVPDVDHIYNTDEYKNNIWLKIYDKCVSNPIKKGINVINKLKKKV